MNDEAMLIRLNEILENKQLSFSERHSMREAIKRFQAPAHDVEVVYLIYHGDGECAVDEVSKADYDEHEGPKLILYTAPPRVVDAKVIEALKDAEEIMHAYFFPANECKDCGNHVDGWHETGCIAGSILDKHRKIISELEAK